MAATDETAQFVYLFHLIRIIMKSLSRHITLVQFEDFNALPDEIERALCVRSFEAQNDAYAPYSKFKVGVAVLLDNGEIITGSNQENAVFPLGLCGERVAIFSANNVYPSSKILKMAISTSTKSEQLAFPCGSCRQVLLEEEYKIDQPIKLFVVGSNRQLLVVESAKDLLPFSFNSSFL